jgi:hypothetical protein
MSTSCTGARPLDDYPGWRDYLDAVAFAKQRDHNARRE